MQRDAANSCKSRQTASASWGKACDRAGVSDLTFHDFKGTAVVRLAIAGAMAPQIATFKSHSRKDVETILEAHSRGREQRC